MDNTMENNTKLEILYVDPISAESVVSLNEKYSQDGSEVIIDILLIKQKYSLKYRKVSRNVYAGEVREPIMYDKIMLSGCINHYPNIDAFIKTIVGLLKFGGHLYTSYDIRPTFNRISDLFAFGAGKLLKTEGSDRRERSYIELDELMLELRDSGAVIYDLEFGEPAELEELEQNIRRYIDNEDFIVTILDRVRYKYFDINICRVVIS